MTDESHAPSGAAGHHSMRDTRNTNTRTQCDANPPGRTRRVRSGFWSPGVHVAPFLSCSGRFILVAIGRAHLFMVAAEVAALEDGPGLGTSAHPDLSYPAWILEPQKTRTTNGAIADIGIPFLRSLGALNGGRPLDALLWSRGVHLAPWRNAYDTGGELGHGRPMLAIDGRHRLVAEIVLPDGADPEPVHRDLLAILEAAEAISQD